MSRTTITSAVLILLVSAATLILPRLSSSPAMAGDQTVTLAVENMTCAACSITVGSAIKRVHGVSEVNVDFETKRAVVIFDDNKTTPDAIASGSSNVGYPAHVMTTGISPKN